MAIYSCKAGNNRIYMHDKTAGKKGSNESVLLLKHCIDNNISEEVKILNFSATTVQVKAKTF
jgi:hypothetical protein